MNSPLCELSGLGGPLSLRRILHIVDGVADSLAEAHSKGIVHRDIKPENIFLEPHPGEADFVKVLDFGIAKILGDSHLEGRPLTAEGERVGTLLYMSPEQLMGRDLDGRSDLYSLGVVAFEMATGTLPFKARTPGEMINLQMSTQPPALSSIQPGLLLAFERLILRLLARQREDRPANAAELKIALRSISEALTVATAKPDRIFISYSPKDKQWLEKLRIHLTPLLKRTSIDLWDDTRIRPGALWKVETEAALSYAKAAVLLVTPDFLASDLITRNELLPLLSASRTRGLPILWIAVSASSFEATEIATYQPLNNPSKPLNQIRPATRDAELVRIAEKIAVALTWEPPER